MFIIDDFDSLSWVPFGDAVAVSASDEDLDAVDEVDGGGTADVGDDDTLSATCLISFSSNFDTSASYL